MSTAAPDGLCPGCRTPYEPGTNFCGRCGSQLRLVAATPGASAGAGPRDARAARRGGATTPGASGGSDAQDPWVGRLVDSRYRVLARVGHGGMGVVYKVEHQRMGKIAAMKVLKGELATDRDVVKRFRREAEAVSKLTHPNTVQTFDFGTVEGAMYLVMEYVRGEDLAAILDRDGPLPFLRLAPVIVQACGALAEAHELGIVHRDLKPENILVTRTKDGRDHAKVLDFGLAKLSEREEALDSTGRGAIVGTPYYMSPEAIRGEELDHRADIYALGAVLYRLLTGEHAFEAQTPVGVLTKALTDRLVPPRERRPDLALDARVEAIVLRAMARARGDRHPTVDALREELERTARELDAASSQPRSPPGGPGRPSGLAAAEVPSEPRLSATPAGIAPPTGLLEGAAGAVPPEGAAGAVPLDRRQARDPSVPSRLAREDFDAFERSLRRRGLALLIAAPLAVALAVGGIVGYLRWSGRQPCEVELEPNNDLRSANRIAAGQPVRGHLGRRLDDSTSDRDLYRLPVPGGSAPRRLRARLTAIRNIDLALVVYDAQGAFVVDADNGGVGAPEAIPNLGVPPGAPLYLAVLESREGALGRGPTENVTDEYTLSIELEEAGPDEELEPNNADSDATAIAPDRPLRAHLGRLRDEDHYRFQGPPGRYAVEVTGGGRAAVRLRAPGAAPAEGRSIVAELGARSVVVVERLDAETDAAGRPVAHDVEVPYTLVVTRAP